MDERKDNFVTRIDPGCCLPKGKERYFRLILRLFSHLRYKILHFTEIFAFNVSRETRKKRKNSAECFT